MPLALHPTRSRPFGVKHNNESPNIFGGRPPANSDRKANTRRRCTATGGARQAA